MRINVIWLLIVVGAVFLLGGVAFAQPNFYTFPGPDVDLGQSYLGRVVSGGHYIGGRGDTIYVLRELNHTYCHKSTDGGQTFNPGVRVNSTSGAVNASLRVDTAGVVYVAYQGLVEADIFFTKSTDGGQTFSYGVKVNDDVLPQTGQETPVIAVNGNGHIFIAWRDQRNSPPQTHKSIFSSASYNGGLSFTPNVQVNDSLTPIGGYIDIGASEDGRVYLIWEPNFSPLVLSRSEDSGMTFPFRNTFGTELSSEASLAVNGEIFGVAFPEIEVIGESLRYLLQFSVSTNDGQTLSPILKVDSSNHLQSPSLISSNNIFYSVWRARHKRTTNGPGLDHVWFSYSSDSGKTFASYVDAVPDDTNSVPHFNPTIWVNETEKAFAAWTDTRWDPLFDEDHHLFVSVGKPVLAKGDLNFDGVITFLDIGLELNAVFHGDPFPAPFHRADGNCDWRLTPADMVILLNRWYRDIPFPCN